MPGSRYEGRAVVLTAIELEFLAALEYLTDTREEVPFADIQRFPRNGRSVVEAGNRKGSVFAEIANEVSAVVKDFTRGD